MVCKKLFVAFPWVVTSTGPGGFMICVFNFMTGTPGRLNRKWFYGEARNPDLILDSNFIVENI